MKKILLAFLMLITVTACDFTSDMDNTPTKKVEEYFDKYQTLDESVLEDLETTLDTDTTLSDEDKDEYREFMKKHYQDLTYEIKDETIDGDNATVVVEITVRDYSDVISSANTYKNDNESEFYDESGEYSSALFSQYRLEQLEKVTDTVTYTLNLTLTKINEEWTLDQLSDADLNKINGMYSEE